MNIIDLFEQAGIRVAASKQGKLKLFIPEDLPQEAREKAVSLAMLHKAALFHMIAEPEPGRCETCKAAGYWDHPSYTGKGLLCFHYVMFLGKTGYPTPCIEARKACPLQESRKQAA
ncbi:MAG: hypothetical protein V1714_05670 [Pseudomonadota bacterium]